MREPGAPAQKPRTSGRAVAPPADSAGDDRAAGTGRAGLRALWVRDPGGTSLRRAARVALVVPLMAAFAGTIVGDPGAALFAVFGAFALLGLADFGGPTIPRARAYAGATLVGAGLVLLGTLASGSAWSAVAGTLLVAFVVQFLGVFGGYAVAAQTALLLAFVVAVSVPASTGAVWARVAAWTLAGGVSLAAGVLLWPRHARTLVRQRAGDACHALAALLADPGAPNVRDQARAQVDATRRAYDRAPLRPAGPARRDRALVDLVVQLDRALQFAGRVADASQVRTTVSMVPEDRALRRSIGQTLEASAGVLRGEAPLPDLAALDQDRAAYREALDRWAAERLRAGEPAESVLDGLSGGAASRLLAHAALAIAIDAAVAAGQDVSDAPSPLPHWNAPGPGPRSWLERVRVAFQTHLRPNSVWFQNSLRAGLALGLAVLLTRITRVEHSFWVVLGTLSVLRSNALGTGRTALLAIAGTVVGFVVAVTLAIGTSAVALWITLPVAVFLAAYVPTVVSFLVGQAAFTLFVVVLFDLLQPQGWRLGLVRLEDVALGIAVSLAVAVLLWPRGARGQLRSALAALYRADAACLDAAFAFLLGRRGEGEVDATRRAAAAEVERTGEALEVFLTERGSRMLPAATWGRVAAAGDDVLLAADGMEAMALLGYRPHGCEQCADRVRGDAAEVVSVLVSFADQLQEPRGSPAPRIRAAAETRDAVVGCLRAWRGTPGSPLGPTAIALATAWFWNVEIARLGGELAQPLAAVATAGQSPWWR